MTGLSISQVASRAGIRPSALRYYEDIGLIAPPLRVSTHRRYDARVFKTLSVIAYAKRAGFTIAEIKLLLSGFEAAVSASHRWRALARRKEQDLDAIIASARRMKRVLRVVQECRCLTLDECGRRLGHS